MRMKAITSFMLALGLLLFTVAGALASPYLYFDPTGNQVSADGSSVSVNMYLHLDAADTIYGWGLALGFDDSAKDGHELTYVGYTFGNNPAGSVGAKEYTGYQAGKSYAQPGEGVARVGRYDWSFEGAELSAGDYLLATWTFTFTGGAWDGSDVWLEWESLVSPGWRSFVELESGTYGYTNPMIVSNSGPDYGNAVPIPAAGYLLGGGLLALLGMRRKAA